MNKKAKFFKTLIVCLPCLAGFLAHSAKAANTNENVEQADSISWHADLESVSIQAVRANDKTPVSFQSMAKSDIEKLSNANSIPTLLQFMPSVVTTTENGTGTGNTSFRVRGTDASRTNVMINGLPLNNPESQDVYWVNLPNLSGFLNSIQIQRGVGTSSNGSGAFGATVNLETDKISATPNLDISAVGGSYGTLGANISANSGLLKNGFFAEAKLSKSVGDGYIRNGKTDHQSAYVSAGLVKSKHFLKFNYLYGEQHTGITWEGASTEDLAKDRRYNPSGYMYDDANGKPVYYNNETDNYFSHIAQLFYVFDLSDYLKFNAGFNYTHGYGYYENFKIDQKFSKFNLSQPIVFEGDTFSRADVVRQKLMRNDFYAGNVNFKYSKNNLNVNVGGLYSHYIGEHFGNLKQAYLHNKFVDVNHDDWYDNTGTKTEVSAYAKFDYTFLQNFNAFADVQYRSIAYKMEGFDDDFSPLNLSKNYGFFNPKIGLSYLPDQHQKWYVSVARASREPARADMKEDIKSSVSRIKPEFLTDYEFGWQIQKSTWNFGANAYYMAYKDQLVPNGRLNDVGYKLMDNIEKSHRLGLELMGGWQFHKMLRLDANLTLSQNKVLDYHVVKPIYDENWELDHYEEYTLKSSDLAFSPNVVGGAMLTFSPIKNLSMMLTGKYVGKQFYDNLSTEENSLDAYFVSDLSVYYAYPLKKEGRKIYVQGVINNVLNADYVSNAWVDPYYFTDGSTYVYKGLFAQAPLHFSVKIGITL